MQTSHQKEQSMNSIYNMLIKSIKSCIITTSERGDMLKRLKKAFNTSIDEVVLENFKAKCKEEGLPINIILEKFMNDYAEGKFSFMMQMQYLDNEKTKK